MHLLCFDTDMTSLPSGSFVVIFLLLMAGSWIFTTGVCSLFLETSCPRHGYDGIRVRVIKRVGRN